MTLAVIDNAFDWCFHWLTKNGFSRQAMSLTRSLVKASPMHPHTTLTLTKCSDQGAELNPMPTVLKSTEPRVSILVLEGCGMHVSERHRSSWPAAATSVVSTLTPRGRRAQLRKDVLRYTRRESHRCAAGPRAVCLTWRIESSNCIERTPGVGSQRRAARRCMQMQPAVVNSRKSTFEV